MPGCGDGRGQHPHRIIGAHLIALLDLSMDDSTASWVLDAAGTWEHRHTGPDGEPLQDIQAVLIQRQRRRLGLGR